MTELFSIVADIDLTSHVDDNSPHMGGDTDDVLINNALFGWLESNLLKGNTEKYIRQNQWIHSYQGWWFQKKQIVSVSYF